MIEHTLIERSEDILGGAPVFAGTRVPVQTLIDYLQAGERLDDFLADFPTVTREQAVGVLELAKAALLAEPPAPSRGRYPLRGAPIRYDDPLAPVAEEDWRPPRPADRRRSDTVD